jgi:hypothetical protein
MILKFIYRMCKQTRAVYFTGWEEGDTENQLSPGYIGDVNHPYSPWLASAKIISKSEAEKIKPLFYKICKDNLGDGTLSIIKEARAKRAGWRG